MEIDALTIVLTIAIAILLSYIKLSSSEPDIHPLLLNQQSNATLIRNEGESPIHRSRSIPLTAALEKQPFSTLVSGHGGSGDIKTLNDQSYEQVDRRITGFGSGFIALTNLKPNEEVPVGIYTPYSQESFIAQQAFYRYNFVAVPIHELRDKDFLIEVVNQTKLKAIIVTPRTLPLLLESLKECPSIKTIIVAGLYFSPQQAAVAAEAGITLVKFSRVELDGLASPQDPIKPEPTNVAMINYNTKSSSLSKGVLLTHENLVAGMTGFQSSLPGAKKLTSKDRLLSHFSNGDVVAVTMASAVILAGGSLIFTSGLMKNVLHDAQDSNPTIFASTPVILEKIHEALQLSYGNGSLFQRAFGAKQALVRKGVVTATSLWDFIALGQVRSKLGGHVRIIVTTYPTKTETLEYFRAALGIRVVGTYGRTETAGTVTSRNLYDYSNSAHLGAPVNCNEIKLVDDVAGGYKTTDEPYGRGEILVRGPNVTKGFYKKPSATASAIDSEGWFHTGEIGMIHPNGTLEVIGKKKKAKTVAESP
ncbi:hypothetical protein BGZ94_010179 [Podila epigama]|nr:hypothetical protein BGZ94_010179 [Podila epigama]